MKVWVTRDEEPAGPFCTALESFGLEAIHEPVIERHIRGDIRPIIERLGPSDWLVLTSPFAVGAVATEAARVPKVAVVGEKSRDAAMAKGLRVELVAPGRDAGTLFERLQAQVTKGTICYARSSLATPPKSWPGVEIISPVLYETRPRPFDRSVADRVDLISVASPSAVEALGAVDLPYASIGPTTSAALLKIGVTLTIEAPSRSFESLAEAIADYARSLHHRA